MDWRRCARSRAVRARARAACERTRSPWARLILFAALQFADQRFEILGLAEILVDRGEAHIGDLVQARRAPASPVRRSPCDGISFSPMLSSRRTMPVIMRSTRSRSTGRLRRACVMRALQLVAVERLAPAVLLDHDQFAQLHALEGGEAPAALRAMAAAADGGIVLATAGCPSPGCRHVRRTGSA